MLTAEDCQSQAKIKQSCEQCGATEMRYVVLQLRGADEGATVFFTCPKCNFKYVKCPSVAYKDMLTTAPIIGTAQTIKHHDLAPCCRRTTSF